MNEGIVLFFGMGIGAAIMFLAQLFVSARPTEGFTYPSYLPSRVDTLARWGALKSYVVRSALPPQDERPLPRRLPGASLVLNPEVAVEHVMPLPVITQWELCTGWIREWWHRRVRRIEESLDPFAKWDVASWWREAFYVPTNGRHRRPEPTHGIWLTDTQWMRIVPTVDSTMSRNRRVRTEAEWARIIATNLRTKAIRDAHHSRGSGLVWEDDALTRDLEAVRG